MRRIRPATSKRKVNWRRKSLSDRTQRAVDVRDIREQILNGQPSGIFVHKDELDVDNPQFFDIYVKPTNELETYENVRPRYIEDGLVAPLSGSYVMPQVSRGIVGRIGVGRWKDAV